MGEILGLGLSHYPGFMYPDEDMAMRIAQTLKSGKIRPELKEPRNWPEPMRAEWGEDGGLTFARKHREEFVSSVRRLRRALDEFAPDAVVIFGDDQYENFVEDTVPPFCLFIASEFESRPFLKGRGRSESQPNVWGESPDKVVQLKGHGDAARYLARELLRKDFDVAYAYRLRYAQGLGHAFIRAVLYLDYDRQGWNYPIVPFHVNAYGSSLVSSRGGSAHLSNEHAAEPDPPAPSPRRCFELGRAIARAFKASPWRIALVGSSSWSHAFLTEKNHWLYPDVLSDRKRFEELAAGDYLKWRDIPREDLEQAGQHELLNWVPMVGAMHELSQKPAWCRLIESYLMNSCKCSAFFPPHVAGKP
jgi:hypothetical protein